MKYKIIDKEYQDGCFQGVLQITNSQDGGEEAYTFVYDKEMDSLDLVRREYAGWNAPICGGLSDFMCDNYHMIKGMISESAMFYVGR